MSPFINSVHLRKTIKWTHRIRILVKMNKRTHRIRIPGYSRSSGLRRLYERCILHTMELSRLHVSLLQPLFKCLFKNIGTGIINAGRSSSESPKNRTNVVFCLMFQDQATHRFFVMSHFNNLFICLNRSFLALESLTVQQFSHYWSHKYSLKPSTAKFIPTMFLAQPTSFKRGDEGQPSIWCMTFYHIDQNIHQIDGNILPVCLSVGRSDDKIHSSSWNWTLLVH